MTTRSTPAGDGGRISGIDRGVATQAATWGTLGMCQACPLGIVSNVASRPQAHL
jgi:hypothetical protein